MSWRLNTSPPTMPIDHAHRHVLTFLLPNKRRNKMRALRGAAYLILPGGI